MYSFKLALQNIFKDRAKLSPRYIPKELFHRQKQIDTLVRTFIDIKNDPYEFPLTVLQVIGPTGIGKTSTVIKFGNFLEKEMKDYKISINIVYINLKLQGGNKYAIYKYLLGCIAPELPAQGLSAEEMLRQLLDYLNNNAIFALIILDEIDYLIKIAKDIGIIYDLTRLNEFQPGKKCNVKGVIFIARSIEFYEKLDPAELSSLGRLSVEFPAYTIEQISDILVERSREAFNEGVIGTSVIDWISKIVVSPVVNGDIRYALDLMLHAGNLAENDGTEKILVQQVKTVHNQIYNGITDDDVDQLSKNQIVILLGTIKGLRRGDNDYVDLKEIRGQSLEIAANYKIKKIDIEDTVDELVVKKIIKIISLKKICLIASSIDKLEKILKDKIITLVER